MLTSGKRAKKVSRRLGEMMNGSYPHSLSNIVVMGVLFVTLISLTAHASQSDVAPPGVDSVAEVDFSNGYAINLLSSLTPIDLSALPRLDVFQRYRLYTTRFKKGGKVWLRLRLGFFPTKQAAEKVLDSLRRTFPSASVTKVSRKEREQVARRPIAAPTPEPAAPKRPGRSKQIAAGQEPSGKDALLPISEERLARLMEEAEKAITSGNYRHAVQYYTKILEYPDHKFRQDAQEFLGLARERNGQLAHARAEYEKYLRLYPKGEAADRVRQRLAGLVTARAKPKEKLREAKKTEAKTEIYGTFSQFYNRFESFTDPGGNVVNRSSLSSDFDVNARRHTDVYDMSFAFTGGYDSDFLDAGDSESSLSQLYIDMLDRRRHISGRIGRQSRSTDGVLGRFDGGVLSYQLFPRVKVNGLSGLPVESSNFDNLDILKNYDTDKYFYGLSLDLGTFANHWDFNIFTIKQEANGITDRHAVGGEVRYFDANRSFFTLVDYDISYNELNTFVFVGNWIFPDKTTINTVVDYRTSPILTTSNAIIGQGVDSLSDLLATLSEDEVRDLARDRTATSRSFTLGITHPLSQKFQIGGEFMVSELTGTEASGGVEAVPGTGYEYFYSTQLIGSSLIMEGDITILGMRYSDTSSSDSVSLNLNTRYPVTREFRINPRMQVDYRLRNENTGDQLKFRPSLTMDYYWNKRVRFELDGGVEWTPDWVSGQTDTVLDFFITVGWRWDF